MLGTLGASLLGKMLARKGIVRALSVVLEIKNEKELWKEKRAGYGNEMDF